MTNSDSFSPAASAGAASELRPDARLVSLHAERGDAHTRLEAALAALEGADWGLTLAGEAALGQQLRALLGAGVLRLDPRLPLRRDLLAEAGLAAASLEGDWRGAVAVWLLEPGEEDLARAARAGVPVIVDATLAPGAHWLAAGARYVTFHHGGALTGFGEGELALLFGTGARPTPSAAPAADLTVALALRDVATLPLRLARAAQTAAALAEQLQGRALPLGPTALLLAPEAVATTAAPLGGVLPAARPVHGGVILTPGLADARQVRALLRDEPQGTGERRSGENERQPRADDVTSDQSDQPERENSQEERRAEQSQFEPHREERYKGREQRREQLQPVEGQRGERQEFRGRSEQSQRPDGRQGDIQPAPSLERFVFEAPRSPEMEPAQALPAPLAEPAVQEDPETFEVVPELPTQAEGMLPADEAAVEDQPPVTPQPTETAPLQPDLPVEQVGSGKPDPASDLTEEQSAIFARLRDWRNAEASRQEISRFIVASNATLAEIARRVPYTIDDLRSIKGMGPARLSKYGEAIVQVVRGQRR